MEVVAIFGPTAVGKTGVAIELAELLRTDEEDPIAVSCDAIQVYRGLEILSGAAGAAEQARLEHRLLGVVGVDEEFSAGRFATLAHAEIDALLDAGRRPIVVGGTGLYLRAALAELELRPSVPSELRAVVERELETRGAAALHGELAPELARGVHPNDRKRIARLTELGRLGIAPHASSDGLWAGATRHPTRLFGLTVEREALRARIEARVDAMIAAGAVEEARFAAAAGASRTARAALGFEALLTGDAESVRAAHRGYARRQLTWMRRMPGVELIERDGLDNRDVATQIHRALRSPAAG